MEFIPLMLPLPFMLPMLVFPPPLVLALLAFAPPVVLAFPPVVLVFVPVVVAALVVEVLLVEVLVVVLFVVVMLALPFVFSVAQPVQKAATASKAKRAKVLRIECSPVTLWVRLLRAVRG